MKNKEKQIILLIEDNPGDIILIKEMLTNNTSFNYELIIAETLKDGCVQIEKNNFNLILLDINLPDSIGKQTFDTILQFSANIPIVLISGMQDEELSLSLIKEGAQDYILKQELNSRLLVKTILYALIRMQNDEAMQASKDYLDKIINTVASPIFVKDDKHKFCLVNDALCLLLKLTVEKVIGTTGYEYLPEDQMKIFIAKDQEVFKTGKENINEELLTDGTGKIRTIVTRKTLYTDALGNKFLVGVINDITERKQMEVELVNHRNHLEELVKNRTEELEIAIQTKNKFFSIIAHDLRNPFAGLLASCEILKRNIIKQDMEKIEKFADSIFSTTKNTYSLLENLLEWSCLQLGKIEVKKEQFDISQCIKDALASIENFANEKGIEIVISSHEVESNDAFFDLEMFKTIMRNLVTNAIKFSNKGEMVFVESFDEDEEYFKVTVRDTGVGISKEDKEKLFRIDVSHVSYGTNNERGTGLGLLLCQEFAKKNGSEIFVKSIEGKGSTFRFRVKKVAI